MYFAKTGLYGTSYRDRALITWYGLGANRPQDAVYPTSEGPDILKKYSARAKKYVVRTSRRASCRWRTGFWSIVMYDKNYFFVPNALNRYTVSSRSKFKTNADGSIDLYFQNESPGKDKEQNWLPAPKDEFVLMMRLYWPSEKPPSILDGTWKPPEVKESVLTASPKPTPETPAPTGRRFERAAGIPGSSFPPFSLFFPLLFFFPK